MAREVTNTAGLVPSMEWAPGTDPLSQRHLWVPENAYEWQKDIWRACMMRGSRVAAVTPNESGKTSVVIPVLGLSCMATFPGCKVVSTAGVERQITEGLWPVLDATLMRRKDWHITAELNITAPSIDGLPGSSWEAFTTKDAGKAEGFHPRWYRDENGVLRYAPLVVIVDEGKSFQGKLGYDLIRTFVRRCSPDILLFISTPGVDDGPFFDCFNRLRGKPWETFEVGWDDCPHLQRDFKLQERLDSIAELGDDHPFNQSWIHGKFFRKGDWFIFDMSDVDVAMSGLVPPVRGDRFVAMDYSGGGDSQVIALREGNTLEKMIVFHERDTTKLGDQFVALINKWQVRPENIFGDEGGLGKPCTDYIERRLGYGIQRYLFNAVPRNKKRFKSRAAEDHFEVKYLMSKKAINLPHDDDLKDELRKRRFQIKTDDNLIRLEPKEDLRKRGEQSPGRLDTLIMAFSEAPPLTARDMPKAQNTNPCGDYRDCTKNAEDDEADDSCGWGGYWGDE